MGEVAKIVYGFWLCILNEQTQNKKKKWFPVKYAYYKSSFHFGKSYDVFYYKTIDWLDCI